MNYNTIMKSTSFAHRAVALVVALLALASAAAAQGPCTSNDECSSDFFQSQFCDNGRCMPTTCTGGSFKGCQQFDKRTYCPARAGNVKCAPRLQAGQVCNWIPDFGQEQPCAPGLVCTGFVTMTCVRGGKGPLTMNGLPEHEAMAKASADEKPDDSIPPRVAGARPVVLASASRTSASATESGSATSTPVNPFAPSGTGNDFSFTPNGSSSSSSSTMTTVLIIFSFVAVGAAVGVVAVGRVRRRRYVPRPPTAPAPVPAAPIAPKPMAPPAPAVHRPYGSPIEEHVEYVPVGQTKTVVEVPLQSMTSPAYPPQQQHAAVNMPVPTAYPPAAHAYMSMPQPAPAPAAPMSPAAYPATMPMPSPQPVYSPTSTPGVYAARPDPSNVSGGPIGPTVEVHAGPGDAELVLPGGAGAGTGTGGLRVEVAGNKDDEELVLPGPRP